MVQDVSTAYSAMRLNVASFIHFIRHFDHFILLKTYFIAFSFHLFRTNIIFWRIIEIHI